MTQQSTPSEQVRPDFALQIHMRTITAADHCDNAEYQIIAAAVRELKRLYQMEMFVISYFETDDEQSRATSLGMVRSYLRPGAIETEPIA